MRIRHPYRTGKKALRVVKTGKITPGQAQALGRYIRVDMPRSNYKNPKVRRTK